MANNDWKSIDLNYVPRGEPVYCAFLDILGYRNKIDAYYDGSLNLVDRIHRALEPVQSIKKIMDATSADREGGRLRHLSDSIIITYPQTDAGLRNVLHDAGVIAAHMSMDELFIRGGIAGGLHFDSEINGVPVLVSSALRKAHCLEQTAKMPRILIDPALADQLPAENTQYVMREGDDLIVHFLQRFASDPNVSQLLAKEIVDIAAYREKYGSDTSTIQKLDYLIDYYTWMLGQLGGGETTRDASNDRGFKPFNPRHSSTK